MITDATKLQKQALNLPPQERERLALVVWESLEGAAVIDPEGIETARRRDAEIESGAVQAIDHAEFVRRTNGSG